VFFYSGSQCRFASLPFGGLVRYQEKNVGSKTYAESPRSLASFRSSAMDSFCHARESRAEETRLLATGRGKQDRLRGERARRSMLISKQVDHNYKKV
jgi:hypothetical protein